TLHHLLSHTSGIFDYMNDDNSWRNDFSKDPRRDWSHNDIIAYLYDKPLLFEPGTDYHYSNSNYILVGRIIEQVSGQPLHQQIRQRILSPLNLRHTFNGAEPIRARKRARGYINRFGHIIDTFPWYSHYGLADSGMHSTPADLAMLIQSLFTSEAVLSERMRMLMTDVSSSGQLGDDYGMGIYVQYNPWGAGLRWYTHDGIDPGYQADIMYLPDYDFVVVVATNASLGAANVIYEKLITRVIQVAVGTVRENKLKQHDYSY
ncbi:MAG: beta-lactamase family protein, partial [Gammaproteobacteria bacterium]|nr:beta-lactamase family protein [Gammaproteobacteria bacterium]